MRKTHSQNQKTDKTVQDILYRRARNYIALLAFTIAVCASISQATTLDDLNSSIDALNTKITTIGILVNSAVVDVSNAFNRLKTKTNLSEGALMVGGIVQARTGQIVDWPISFVETPVAIAAVQGDIILPSSFTILGIDAGPAATQAGKTVSRNNARFIVFGLNQTPIGSGVLAIVHLQVPSNASPVLTPISINNPIASDPTGKTVLISATSGTLGVQP